MTVSWTKINITLDGWPVYYFDVWVDDQVGQEAILGMDFMVSACIRLDLADGALCLPDEVCVFLTGRNCHTDIMYWWLALTIKILSFLPVDRPKSGPASILPSPNSG